MASVRQRATDRFTGLYRDRSGHQRSAGTFGSKREALKAARGAEALEARGKDARQVLREPEAVYAVERRGHVTVAGYLPQFIKGARLEPTSRRNYTEMSKRIEQGLGNVPVRDLTPAKVREFVRGLEETDLSTATVAHTLTVIRSMCRAAVIDGLLGSDPTAGVPVAKVRAREMRIATPAQARAIQEALPQPYRLLAETLFATGMRYSEAMGLRAEDIEIGESAALIKVRRVIVEVGSKPQIREYGKTARATRSITIETDLARRLVASARDEWCFRAMRGGYLARASFWRSWKPACAAVGLPGLRIHDARHSHISWLANDARVPLAAVRDRAGHASLATTSRYVHLMPDELDPCLVALRAAA